METSKRNLLLLLLSMPSFKAFSCTGPYDVIARYSEKKSLGGPYIEASTEEFLNQTYGQYNWRYDETLFIKLPDFPENPRVVPIETGVNGDEAVAGYTELSIYAEEYISVLKPGISYTVLNPGSGHKVLNAGYGQPNFPRDEYKETKVFEIAKYKFYESATPYVATRLNLSGTSKVRIFCVFTTNNKGLVRVIRQPKAMYTEYCSHTVYEKD